jgi:hypothetical protein
MLRSGDAALAGWRKLQLKRMREIDSQRRWVQARLATLQWSATEQGGQTC